MKEKLNPTGVNDPVGSSTWTRGSSAKIQVLQSSSAVKAVIRREFIHPTPGLGRGGNAASISLTASNPTEFGDVCWVPHPSLGGSLRSQYVLVCKLFLFSRPIVFNGLGGNCSQTIECVRFIRIHVQRKDLAAWKARRKYARVWKICESGQLPRCVRRWATQLRREDESRDKKLPRPHLRDSTEGEEAGEGRRSRSRVIRNGSVRHNCTIANCSSCGPPAKPLSRH